MTAKHGLGRGLNALIKEIPSGNIPSENNAGVVTIPITKIVKNTLQPRHDFDRDALDELIASIREHGVIQPVVVRRKGDAFELIAGERRFRAASAAGLESVPAVVRDVDDQASLELALVENLQRSDLNPLDEADGYRALADNFRMTQDEIARKVGKGRATVANSLRLLSLPEDVRELVRSGALSSGHAKALLGVEIDEEKKILARRVLRENLSVRALEKIISSTTRKRRKSRVTVDIPEGHVQYLSDKLHHLFGTSVRITPCKTLADGRKQKGRIEVDFFSNDDLSRILELLGLSE